MKLFKALAVLFLPIALQAQTETFDIVTYQPPIGWKKTAADYAVSYSIVDNASGGWCQVAVYKSVASSGNAATDFSNEWKSLVKQDTYAGAIEPVPTSVQQDGWTTSVGQSKFNWQGKDSYVMLVNVSGYGVMATIHLSMNTDKYFNEIETLVASVQLKKPAQPVQQSVQQTQPTNTPVATSNDTNIKTITVTNAPGVHGIKLSSTNFDDGWVSQPFADYVKVVKQSTTVLLHYAIEINDEMRQADNMAVYFWDRLMASHYRSNNLVVFKNEPYTYNKVYFIEGDGTELSTGKSCHVALRVLVYNGIANCVEITAPNASAFQQEFPNQEKIESMMNYNKFAVSAADIVGTWEESSTTAVNMYNTVTGGYAGMNAVAMAASFTIVGDGTYDSEHKGASGMVGSMSTYDQKYHGKWTLTPWEVTMTNRWQGKTDVYLCSYEAVRGGRILHFRDKSASAMTYRLVKTR